MNAITYNILVPIVALGLIGCQSSEGGSANEVCSTKESVCNVVIGTRSITLPTSDVIIKRALHEEGTRFVEAGPGRRFPVLPPPDSGEVAAEYAIIFTQRAESRRGIHVNVYLYVDHGGQVFLLEKRVSAENPYQ